MLNRLGAKPRGFPQIWDEHFLPPLGLIASNGRRGMRSTCPQGLTPPVATATRCRGILRAGAFPSEGRFALRSLTPTTSVESMDGDVVGKGSCRLRSRSQVLRHSPRISVEPAREQEVFSTEDTPSEQRVLTVFLYQTGPLPTNRILWDRSHKAIKQ